MNEARIAVGIQACGVAQASLAAAQDYAAQRVQMKKPIREHPLVAASLVSTSRALRKLQRKKEAKANVARAEQIMSLPGNAAFANNNTIDVRSFRAGN